MSLIVDMGALQREVESAKDELGNAELCLVQAQNRLNTAQSDYHNAVSQFEAGFDHVLHQ